MVKKLHKMEKKSASAAGLLDSQLASTVKDSAQQIWLAGMGAFAKAQAEGGKVFEALVKEGVSLQRKTQAVAEEKLGDVTGKMSSMASEVTSKAGAFIDFLTEVLDTGGLMQRPEDSIPVEKLNDAASAAMESELGNPAVEGLLVDYTHFYGSFWTEVNSFGWYYKEVRVVRRSPEIRAWGGAQGFRTTAGEKLRVKESGGRYFHYGFALEPGQARAKLGNLSALYGDETGARSRSTSFARW